MRYLLDTNVVSEARKPGGNASVVSWLKSVKRSDLYLSAMLLGEVRRGIEMLRRRDSLQAEVFEAWLGVLRREYADRVLPITAEIAETWGRMNVPNPVPVVDGLMAATARVHDLTLVTRNIVHLAPTGVRLLNPFK